MASKKSPEPDSTEPDSAESNDAPAAAGVDAGQPDAPQSDAGRAAPRTSQTQGNRFFSWMRGLGIQRQPGWIGGVGAGIGVRLGVDPIIMRGIIVVIAVLGGPALLLYAAAWLLLPDTNDRIHAEDLGRGRFDPALIGIGVMALLSLLPLNQGFWYAGALYWGDPGWAASLGRVLWTALLLGAIVAFVIWAARRANNTPTVTPATTDDKPDTIPTAPAEASRAEAARAEASAAETSAAETSTASTLLAEQGPDAAPAAASTLSPAVALTAPGAPAVPGPDAAPDELQAWKEQQALWKQQHAEWRAQRAATERELREERAAESRERALLASAEYAEKQRLRRLANPRINAATVFSVLGAALLAGGIAALVASTTLAFSGYEVTVALAVGAVVLGLGIIVAGLCRRRSGVLGFFAVLAVLGLLVSAAIPRDRVLLPPNNQNGVIGESARYTQLFGDLSVSTFSDMGSGVTDIWQGTGTINLWVTDGTGVRVEIRSRSGNIYLSERTNDDGDGNSEYDRSHATETMVKVGDEWVWSTVVGVDSPGIPTLRVWQGAGSIYLYDENITTPTDEEPTP